MPSAGGTLRTGRVGLSRRALLALGRIAAAALTIAMAAIHFHLWSTGYRHVPTIGDLFLLNAVGGVVLGVALLVVPRAVAWMSAAAVAVFTSGTLGALVLSMTVGLFGFKEFAGAPFLDDSYVVEVAGIVVAVALIALSWPDGSRTVSGSRSRDAPEVTKPKY